MPKELKIRIANPAQVERKVISLGGQFTEEESARHTYFRQPAGRVLKVIQSPKGNWLIQFEQQGSGFSRTRKDQLEDASQTLKELTAAHGIATTLTTRSRTYTLKGIEFDLYSIDGVGEFLIQTGDDPTPARFAQLGILDPEYITVPFNELSKN